MLQESTSVYDLTMPSWP